MVTSSGKRSAPILVLLLVLSIWIPADATAQLEATAGVTVVPGAGGEGVQVGPAVAIAVFAGRPGVPLWFEAGVGRTDFTTLGQDYHDDHYTLAIGTEWKAIRGSTSVRLRLGLGAYGEYQTVETDPPRGGGDNWFEMIVPGVSVSRSLSTDTRVVLTLTDALLGPVYAIFDPAEYRIEHRVRLLIGVQF